MERKRVVIFEPITRIIRIFRTFPEPREKYFNLKFWLFYTHFQMILPYTAALGLWYMLSGEKTLIFRIIIPNIAVIISVSGGMMTIITLFSKRRVTLELVNELEDFTKFGIPKDADKIALQVKLMVKVFIPSFVLGCVFYYASGVLNYKNCVEMNDEYDVNFFCGCVVYFWSPIDINNNFIGYLLPIVMTFSAFILMTNALIYVVLILTIMMCINSRTRHLIHLFGKAFNCTDKMECRRQIIMCYEYHQDIIKLSDKMNDACSEVALLHLVWTAIVLGICGYELVVFHTGGSLVHLASWMMSLFTLSLGGQSLINEGNLLKETIFAFHWYEKDIIVQKELILVLLRMQKTACYKAKGFGVLNFETFQKTLKSAYQFLTLLIQMV